MIAFTDWAVRILSRTYEAARRLQALEPSWRGDAEVVRRMQNARLARIRELEQRRMANAEAVRALLNRKERDNAAQQELARRMAAAAQLRETLAKGGWVGLALIGAMMILVWESLMFRANDYSLGNLTLHYWIGGATESLQTGDPGILNNPRIHEALWNSLKLGFSASIVNGLLGLLVGYAIVRSRGSVMAKALEGISFAPYIFPSIALGTKAVWLPAALIVLGGALLLVESLRSNTIVGLFASVTVSPQPTMIPAFLAGIAANITFALGMAFFRGSTLDLWGVVLAVITAGGLKLAGILP